MKYSKKQCYGSLLAYAQDQGRSQPYYKALMDHLSIKYD